MSIRSLSTSTLTRQTNFATMATVAVPSGAVASGGTESEITIGGVPFRLHTFTSSDTLTVTTAGTVDYIIVAGGGGGAMRQASNGGAGGGGAGGLLTGSVAVTPGDYSIVIGAGGAGRVGGDGPGSDGQDSTGFGQTATGGGGGGYGAGRSGGSGGGAGSTSASGGGSGGAGTAGQGFAGGSSIAANRSGAGGGAGNVGTSEAPEVGMPGAPLDCSAFIGNARNTLWLAGGGAAQDAGGQSITDSRSGGVIPRGDGVANTGGGGACAFNSSSQAGDGADGVVYVRYAI